jgi:hypothetical protein
VFRTIESRPSAMARHGRRSPATAGLRRHKIGGPWCCGTKIERSSDAARDGSQRRRSGRPLSHRRHSDRREPQGVPPRRLGRGFDLWQIGSSYAQRDVVDWTLTRRRCVPVSATSPCRWRGASGDPTRASCATPRQSTTDRSITASAGLSLTTLPRYVVGMAEKFRRPLSIR